MNWMIRHYTDTSSWWHDRFGWSQYDSAQVFTPKERKTYVLPRYGIWVRRRM